MAHRTRLLRTAANAIALAVLLGGAAAPAIARPVRAHPALQYEALPRRFPDPGDPDIPEGPGRGSALQLQPVRPPLAQPSTWLAALFAFGIRMRL